MNKKVWGEIKYQWWGIPYRVSSAAYTLWLQFTKRYAKREQFCSLEIAAYSPDETVAHLCIEKTKRAIELIQRTDPRRFARIQQEVHSIYCFTLPAQESRRYWHPLKICILDTTYVAQDTISLYHVANIIVHEAAHARLRHLGIRNKIERRARIKQLCIQSEIAFTRRIPDTEAYVQWLEEKPRNIKV